MSESHATERAADHESPADIVIRFSDLCWVVLITLIGSVLVAVAVLAVSFAVPVLSGGEVRLKGRAEAEDLVKLTMALGPLLAAWVGIRFVMRRRGFGAAAFGFGRVGLRWLAAAVVLAIGFDLAVEAADRLFDLDPTDAGSSYVSRLLPSHVAWYTIAILFLVLGPLTALVEEGFFRGMLYRWMRRHLGVPLGLALSSLVFTLVHFHFLYPGGLVGWAWTASAFLLACLMAALFEYSRSLWPPILCHVTNNVAGLSLVLNAAE